MMSTSIPRGETAVGLDVGTGSLKGIALGPDGRVLAKAESSYSFQTPRPGWTEQDPEVWWQAARTVLEELEHSAGPPCGIGLSGQMHGLVALDDADLVLRPALLWNDQRTAAEAAEIEQRMGGVAGLVAATGNRALTGFTAPKLLWIERHEPDIYGRVARLLLPKDYVRLRLCGEHVTDVTDASGTLWFDVRRRRWSDEVLRTLGVPADWLPPALESPQISGHTRRGIPVAAGAGDQGAGALGVGAIGTQPSGRGQAPGPESIVLGTSGVVCSPLASYSADPHGRLQASCHALPNAWFAMGVMLSAAGSLAWLGRVAGGVSPSDLVAEAEGWGPGAEGVLFLPYLTGERSPHHDPGARGAFVGLSARHDRGALARAVLEGVAFAMRDSLDLVRTLGGGQDIARVSGGGARSKLWLRILASVLELVLEQPQVEEGAAYGAALLGGVAGGLWRTAEEAVTASVGVRATVEPDPRLVQRYRDERTRFLALYPAVRPLSDP
jgi:xylulokinase